MARTGVSYEEIEKVATQLYQQGINPTVQRIRNQLGTGSNTTIARHLKTWHETFFADDSTRLPMTIPDEVVASVDGFWAAAVAKADDNYQQYREEMENERDLAIEEKDAALLRLAEVEQNNQQLQQQLRDTQQAIQQRTREFDRLQGQYDELVKQHDTASKETSESKALAQTSLEQTKQLQQSFESQLAEQKQQSENVIDDLKQQLQEAHSRHETLENRYLVKMDELQHALKLANQRVAELEKSLSNEQKLMETNQQLFDQQLKQLETQHSVTQQQLQESKAEIIALQDKLKITLSNHQTDLSQNEKLFNVCSQLVKNQDLFQKEIAKLEVMISSVQTPSTK